MATYTKIPYYEGIDVDSVILEADIEACNDRDALIAFGTYLQKEKESTIDMSSWTNKDTTIKTIQDAIKADAEFKKIVTAPELPSKDGDGQS